jgi:nucleoside-diphosphate-sugar epimerase
MEFAGRSFTRKHLLDAPKGVNGRNSDNEMIRAALGWEPSISLREGLRKTYDWIESQIVLQAAADAATAVPA